MPATFQIIYVIGWQYDESQPKPMKRGSGALIEGPECSEIGQACEAIVREVNINDDT